MGRKWFCLYEPHRRSTAGQESDRGISQSPKKGRPAANQVSRPAPLLRDAASGTGGPRPRGDADTGALRHINDARVHPCHAGASAQSSRADGNLDFSGQSASAGTGTLMRWYQLPATLNKSFHRERGDRRGAPVLADPSPTFRPVSQFASCDRGITTNRPGTRGSSAK